MLTGPAVKKIGKGGDTSEKSSTKKIQQHTTTNILNASIEDASIADTSIADAIIADASIADASKNKNSDDDGKPGDSQINNNNKRNSDTTNVVLQNEETKEQQDDEDSKGDNTDMKDAPRPNNTPTRSEKSVDDSNAANTTATKKKEAIYDATGEKIKNQRSTRKKQSKVSHNPNTDYASAA